MLRKRTVLLLFTMTFLASTVSAQSPIEDRLAEMSLAAKVASTLASHPSLRSYNFIVDVSGADVTISGKVTNKVEWDYVGSLVSEVAGAGEIRNEVKMTNGERPQEDEILLTGTVQAGTEDTGTMASTTGYHILKAGENLVVLSERYGVSIREIRSWNQLKIGARVPEGAELRVSADAPPRPDQIGDGPELTNVQETASFEDLNFSDSNENMPEFHVVEKGETLWQIAKAYDVTVARLRNLNRMTANVIAEGQQLRLRTK